MLLTDSLVRSGGDLVEVVASGRLVLELTESSRLRIPAGRHFCLYALQAVLPLLPAKQRQLPEGDWLEQDSLVCCPDPEERLIMRIERIGRRRLPTSQLT